MTSPKTVTPDQPQAVPDMVLVPREPTRAMHRAFLNADGPYHFKDGYRHMLAARPILPVETPAVGLLDETSLRARIGEIGNQVYNLGCEHQDDDNLSDRLANLAYLLWALAQQAPTLPVETPAEGLRDPYYGALNDCLVRYRGMAAWAGRRDLVEFIKEFAEHIDNAAPLMKLNRWLGYIQGQLIAAGLTTVEAERDWTRPLFRPLDFPNSAPAPLSGRDGSLREALQTVRALFNVERDEDGSVLWINYGKGALTEMTVILDAALAAVPPQTAKIEGECNHDWVDATNRVVSNGKLCLKCGALAAATDEELSALNADRLAARASSSGEAGDE